MKLGIPSETYPGERRVAAVPMVLPDLQKVGFEILVQAGAGLEAGFSDAAYEEKGARIVDRDTIFAEADMLLQVRCLGANDEHGQPDLQHLRKGQILVGQHDPLSKPNTAARLAEKGVTAFSMEMMPRITRAQSMDILSSMATIAGYRAVLLAAEKLPRLFPMMMTAAGTLKPAKVFIVGVGVAGLQAIATAKRLGAVVSAYDVRPAVAEQVQSLGAKFVEFDLETAGAEDKGGYAKAQSAEFIAKQQSEMMRVVSEHDVVITTAAIPGKKAPILITADMVDKMAPGSVLVDLAAERGGNCELTRPGETVVVDGVQIMGPLNMASDAPSHASLMYARNLTNFIKSLAKDGQWAPDPEDEVVQGTLLCKDGEIVHPRLRELLALPKLETPVEDSAEGSADGEESAD